MGLRRGQLGELQDLWTAIGPVITDSMFHRPGYPAGTGGDVRDREQYRKRTCGAEPSISFSSLLHVTSASADLSVRAYQL
jgi:hypothetical protein